MKSLTLLSACVLPVYALWPQPVSYTNGSSFLFIAKDIKVTYNGNDLKYSGVSSDGSTKQTTFSSQTIVEAGVQRAITTIFTDYLIPWKFYPRNELSEHEPAADAKKTYISTLEITQTGKDNTKTFKALPGEVDESYSLHIFENATASIVAKSSIGVLRALESFTQLFYTQSAGKDIYTPLAPVSITDAPKFAHRGINLDVSRNWYPVSNILRTIDALAWNKFNVIHLHMTDSQSWPMDIPNLHELSQRGAYQTGLAYTAEDIQQIQEYAVYRGIKVIMEFDMPGHTASIAYSHPDLIAAFNEMPWSTYCAEPPCGQLKLNSSAVYSFLEKLWDDVLPRVSPYTPYFHTGGDEVNVQAYLLDETVRSNESSVIQPLLQTFVDYNHAAIRKAGLVPMVWEEMLLTWNITLGSDVVVQSWDSVANSLDKVTALGHKAIASNYNYWYLDCGKGQWLDFVPASFAGFFPFADYCSPTKNWRLMYSFDPVANLTAEQAKLVLGGEVSMWSEQTDPVNLDDMVWPRASAAGEVLWSGRTDASGQNRSQIDASPRLAELRERMVNRGVKAGLVQMVFCTQLNATECSL